MGNVSQKTLNRVHVFDYGSTAFEEKETRDINECVRYKDTDTVTWINIDSAPPVSFLRELRLGFDLHPVIEQDILTLNQRPKVEILDKYIFLRLKMLRVEAGARRIKHEQVSFVVAPRFVITFQQGLRGDVFDHVREAIRSDDHRIRTTGTDYLAYELLDAIVDGFFDVLDFCSTRIDEIEKEIIRDINPHSLRSLDALKREIMHLRKTAWPLRELLSTLERTGSSLVRPETQIYFRDVLAKLAQVTENADMYREMASSLQDFYHMRVNSRTNEVMKFLTVITTIFMPLTLFVGFFGVNFTYLPFVDHLYAPVISLGAMAVLAVGMLMYFKYKEWL